MGGLMLSVIDGLGTVLDPETVSVQRARPVVDRLDRVAKATARAAPPTTSAPRPADR